VIHGQNRLGHPSDIQQHNGSVSFPSFNFSFHGVILSTNHYRIC